MLTAMLRPMYAMLVATLLALVPMQVTAQVDVRPDDVRQAQPFATDWWARAVDRSVSYTLASGGEQRLRWRASADAWSLDQPAGLSLAHLRTEVGGDRLGAGLTFSARLELTRRFELWFDAQMAVHAGAAMTSARAGLVWWFARRVGLLLYASIQVSTDIGSDAFVPSATALDRVGFDDLRRRTALDRRHPLLPAALQRDPIQAGAGLGLVTR